MREQIAAQAARDGYPAKATENYRLAARDCFTAEDLAGAVRCLGECGDLTGSIDRLLRSFDPAAVVDAVRQRLASPLDLGLCLLAAASATGEFGKYSALSALRKHARDVPPDEALLPLKGAALAAD